MENNDIQNPTTEKDVFECPFAACSKSYTRKARLREHLVKQKVIRDENHPATAPEWETEAIKDLLHTFTRPGNLTSEQRKARKQQSMRRCWNKNGPIYVQNQKARREKVRELIQVAGKIQIMATVKNAQFASLLKGEINGRPALQALYRSPPSINDWLPICTSGDNGPPVDDMTFPRFVTYYLPFEAWPYFDISFYNPDEDDNPPLLLKVIPGYTEMRKISLITHPDKRSEDIRYGSQTLLTEAFGIWERVISKSTFKCTPMFDRNNWEEFAAISDDHAKIVELYFAWMSVADEAKKALIPDRARLWDIERAFKENAPGSDGHQQRRDDEEEEEEEEEEDNPEDLLKQLTELDVPRTRRRKAKGQEQAGQTAAQGDGSQQEHEGQAEIQGHETQPNPSRCTRSRTRNSA